MVAESWVMGPRLPSLWLSVRRWMRLGSSIPYMHQSEGVGRSVSSLWLWIKEHRWDISVVIAIVGVAVLLWPTSFHLGSDENARYLLSAIVQSEAAIIAVVVSLSLVAAQLASGHSPRTMALFRQSPSLWGLLLLYIASMLTTLAVLNTVGGHMVVLGWALSLQLRVAISYVLAAACFIALVPYIHSMLGMLSPSRLIEMLASEITPEGMAEYINKDRAAGWLGDDPLQPLVDMVSSSMMRYDHATAGDGVRAIEERAGELLEDEKIEKTDRGSIAVHVCLRLERLGMLAARLDDDAALEVVAYALGKIGKRAADNGLEDAAKRAAEALGNVGKRAADNGLKVAAVVAALALKGIGEKAAEKGFEVAAIAAAYALGKIGKRAADERLEVAAERAAYALEEIGKRAADNGLKDAAEWAALALKGIGEKAADNGLKAAAIAAIIALHTIAKKAEERGLPKPAQVARSAASTISEAMHTAEQNP